MKSKISGYYSEFLGWGFSQACFGIFSVIELKKAIDLNQKHAFPFSSSNSTFSLDQVDSGKSKPSVDHSGICLALRNPMGGLPLD